MRCGNKLLVLVLASALGFSLLAVAIGWRSESRQEPLPCMPLSVLTLVRHNRQELGRVLVEYEKRPLTTTSVPWQLFHGLLARSGDYEIVSNGCGRSCLQWLLKEASWQ